MTDLPHRDMTVPTAGERRDAVARALAWGREHGVSWDGIEFVVDAAGHASIRATRALAPGDQIFALPRALMIVDDELAGSVTGQLDLGPASSRPRDSLAAWLPLEAREPSSPWRPYLDHLPVRFDELPMFQSAADLALLTGTHAHTLALAAQAEVAATYAGLAPAVRARVSLADFAWGVAIVQSRAFHAPATFENRVALMPILDLFDHKVGDTTWSYDMETGLYAVSAERAIAAGESVYFEYGVRGNTHLFLHFGFTLPDNHADDAALVFDGDERLVVACRFDHRFLAALSHARREAASVADRALYDGADVPWLGPEVEQAAWSAIGAAAARGLAAIHAHPSPPGARPWDRACARVRAAERAVLADYVELARAAAAHLGDAREAATAIPEDARGGRHLLRRYLLALAEEIEP